MKYGHWQEARRVVVIGAGTMGSGIAAHLANLGFDVGLLDLTDESVKTGFERAKHARPPHYFVPENSARVQLGTIEQNLDWITGADWVCEAIIEKLDAKRALFELIEPRLMESAAITTNTSGLEIGLLCEGRSESFRARFMGTHFFNPPRYLKLLELIPAPATAPEALVAMTRFLEDKVARRVVPAKDTPGFIANRFGMWAMFHAIHVAEKLGLSVEQADAITGPFLGRPRSASFRLNDIVGLDIMQDIAQNLTARCPRDAHIDTLATPTSMAYLLSKGWIGDKAGHGYYRREGKELLSFDLNTHAYREKQDASFPDLDAIAREPLGVRLGKALELPGDAGEYLRRYLVPVLNYARYLKREISHNVLDFDRVMMWGFGWERGPFGMIDGIGHAKFGIDEPYYREGEMKSFAGPYVMIPQEPQYRKIRDYPVIQSYDGFNVRDLSEGVQAISLTTKVGTINPTLLAELEEFLAVDRGPLVFTSEAKHFSLGFDLSWFLARIEAGEFEAIDAGLSALQRVSLLFSQRRVASAIFGYGLGAGFEMAFQCPIVVALADAMLGFPESKVGLFPGGGGTAEMAHRNQIGGAKTVVEAARALAIGEVSQNAPHAMKLGFLRASDQIVFHPERLITEAREAALSAVPIERAGWAVPVGPVTGMIEQMLGELVAKGDCSSHDKLIGEKIKVVMSKAMSFESALELERSLFIELCHHSLTQSRIRHMLETGKPQRN